MKEPRSMRELHRIREELQGLDPQQKTRLAEQVKRTYRRLYARGA